jgi:hypothetical protein
MSFKARSHPKAGSPWAKGPRRSAARHHPGSVNFALMGILPTFQRAGAGRSRDSGQDARATSPPLLNFGQSRFANDHL